MPARHGWKLRPSPRPGFTVVEASRELSTAPVVVALHDSLHAFRLFRSGVDEAMGRACDLVVLDFGELPLREQLRATPEQHHEINSLRALCSNPHVKVIRQHPGENGLERVVSLCESVGASLLILGADYASSSSLDGALTTRLFRGLFDVLVITDPPDGVDVPATGSDG